MAVVTDYEQAGELKIGQVGIANLRIRTLDPGRLAAEMAQRVKSAPKLFANAAVILDFGGLSDCPEAPVVRALVAALRESGVLPVGIAYGTSAIEALAREVQLPLLATFRASYEYSDGSVAAAPAPEPAKKPVAAETAPAAKPATRPAQAEPTPAKPVPAQGEPGMMQTAPVRSGQQVYAENRDLTVLTTVGAGAEVIADGSIHIYGALRGRALAGAQGNEKARIFCREFHAELVAVAGHYKVLEDIPKELRGKPVQIWLDNEELRIAALD
jgi:septum site-determining protein MinC